jgi:uncharacterized protein (TIGR03083 family)
MAMSIGISEVVKNAAAIPELSHKEAGKLAQIEYEQVLTLLETLDGDDWEQPTYCTEWNVRDMTAHLAGAVTGSTTVAEFVRQNVTHPYVKEAANSIDGTNKLQIEDRGEKRAHELIAEFRQNGQIALNNRQKLPWLLRKIPLPMEPMGLKSFQYLMDMIYPRDQWMHRYDICAATGKKMVITSDHDGRIIDLVLLDIAKKLKKQLANRNIIVQFTGALGGTYQFGTKAEPDCTLEIDVFDFNLRASERISVEEVMQLTAVSGDEAAARWFLSNATVLY